MADWDSDSPTLRDNLQNLLHAIRVHATERRSCHINYIRGWHSAIMKGLESPNPLYIGRFRGESGLEDVCVRIGNHYGTPPHEVKSDLAQFEASLQKVIAHLDGLIPKGTLPDANTLGAVLDLCGWVHAEWVRIHPFANGNGRTARLLANYIAMRYGLPPFVRLRPRPEQAAYAAAATRAMSREWEPTAALFKVMLNTFIDESE